MKEFYHILKRFAVPYIAEMVISSFFDILSALLNVFSFTLLIPILKMLFRINHQVYYFISWHANESIKHIVTNNFYYYISKLIGIYGNSKTLLILGFFLVFMTLLKTLCYFLSSVCIIPMRTGIVRDIRIQLYKKILELPLSFFSEEHKGDIIARISGDVGEVENSITTSFDMLIKNPVLILIYFITLVIVSWQLTAFTLLILPIMVWIMGNIGKKLKSKSLEAQNIWSHIVTQLEETLGSIRIIKAFTAENNMIKRFEDITNRYRKAINKITTKQTLAHPMSEFLGTIIIVIVLWFGGLLIFQHSSFIDAPTFIFYLAILYSIINPLKDFTKAGYSIPKGLASMERIDKILLAQNRIKETDNPFSSICFNAKIEFKNVSFKYQKKNILTNINMVIPQGATVAIVGESGAGKSTLMDLLPRYYDVTQGKIEIDGIDIQKYKIDALRNLIGIVDQEPFLFNDTFSGNIAFGDEKADQKNIEKAAKIANAHEFIMQSEYGYDTLIGDSGIKLSGGERQRISIARAIVKNPRILILDEATSALDTESEHLVQQALEQAKRNRTVIIVAHRLSTIKNADWIYVLRNGEIIEEGRNQDLLTLNGYYKQLYYLQTI